MTSFENKIVLITGAGSGIGATTALAFANQGATVVCADINSESGENIAHQIESTGGRALFLPVDVANHEQVKNLIDQTIAAFGRIDVAFNNAGVEGAPVRTADVTEDDFDHIMAINVKGVWMCMKYEIKHMVAQGSGVIINTASVAGLVGSHSLPVYGASKHAVVGLTKSAAVEYARKGLRINAVCPAVIKTPMVERSLQHLPHFMDSTIKANPSRRLGEADEVAQAVVWLASDAASFVNGVAFPIDGGFTAQ